MIKCCVFSTLMHDVCLLCCADRHQQIYNITLSTTEQSRIQINIQTRIRDQDSELKKHRQMDLTWLERSALIWLYFCPKVFPNVTSRLERFERVAVTGGIAVTSIQKWLNASEKSARKFTPQWFHVVQSMTWKDVKAYFPKRWVNKRSNMRDDMHVKNEINP